MKATLEIPDALYREIKIRAARDGMKIKDQVAKTLSAGLNQSQPTATARPTKKKSPFPLYSGPLGPILEGKDVRSLSFLDDQDELERYQRAFRR